MTEKVYSITSYFIVNNCAVLLSYMLGGISVAVPGEVAGYYEAWRRFGRLPWRRLLQPTIEMCRDGYRVQWSLAHAIRSKELFIRHTPSLRYVDLL